MGSRGSYGFRSNQKDTLFYNHFDSYPEALGIAVVTYCQSIDNWDEVREQVTAFKPAEGKPNKAQKDKANQLKTIDLSVSRKSEDDFYCLTRGAQGNIALTLDLGFGTTANDFVENSLFCKYAYIINLDAMELEFYQGFNKDPKQNGRYANQPLDNDNSYAGIKLAGNCALTDIPPTWETMFYPVED